MEPVRTVSNFQNAGTTFESDAVEPRRTGGNGHASRPAGQAVGKKMLAKLCRFGRPVEWAAVVILAVTGVLKIIAAFQRDPIMDLNDPVFTISNRELYIALGFVEIGIAYYLVVSSNNFIKTLSLIWLLACFLVYRLGWWWSGIGTPCPCLGTGYGWAPWLQANLSKLSLLTFVAFAVVVALRTAVHFVSTRTGTMSRSPVVRMGTDHQQFFS